MTMAEHTDWQRSEPFDLPDWLGEEDLVWSLDGSLSAAQVCGTLRGAGEHRLGLDIVCADVAYPAPVVPEPVRRQCHLTWHHGQIQTIRNGQRHGLAVPVSSLDADTVCEALRRFARAIAVDSERVRVLISL